MRGWYLIIIIGLSLSCDNKGLNEPSIPPEKPILFIQDQPITLTNFLTFQKNRSDTLLDQSFTLVESLSKNLEELKYKANEYLNHQALYLDLHENQFEKQAEIRSSLNLALQRVTNQIKQKTLEELWVKELTTPDYTGYEKQLRIRHILVRYNSIEEAKQSIEEAHRRIVAGEPFERIAKLYSADWKSRAYDGSVGWIYPGHLFNELEPIVFDLPIGGVSPILESPQGWHIFKVIRKVTHPQSKVRALTIFVPHPKTVSEEEKEAAQSKIRLIANRLKKESFNSIALEYSEDKATSTMGGGIEGFGPFPDRDISLSWIPEAEWSLYFPGLGKDLWELPLSTPFGPAYSHLGSHFIQIVAKQDIPAEQLDGQDKLLRTTLLNKQKSWLLRKKRDDIYEQYSKEYTIPVRLNDINSDKTPTDTVILTHQSGINYQYGDFRLHNTFPSGIKLKEAVDGKILSLAYEKEIEKLPIQEDESYTQFLESKTQDILVSYYKTYLTNKLKSTIASPTIEQVKEYYTANTQEFERRALKPIPFNQIIDEIKKDSGLTSEKELRVYYETHLAKYSDIEIVKDPIEKVTDKIKNSIIDTETNTQLDAKIQELKKKYKMRINDDFFYRSVT